MVMFTIGTSNRSEAEFFDQLKARRVTKIVDVRSKPWSRLPQFRGSALTNAAPAHGIQYEWAGALLGGLNEIATDDPAFLVALDRLLQADSSVAIFCAEGNPAECHRSYKCGAAALVHRGVDPINILRDGRDEHVSRTLLRTRGADIPPCIRATALKMAAEHGAIVTQ